MKKQIKKIILEFPTTSDLSKKDKFVVNINTKKDKKHGGKWVDSFNVEIGIDFFRFLEEAVKNLGGKVKYE